MPKNLVVLTGAGISVESGIKTFRDSNGLWENHDITPYTASEGMRLIKEQLMVKCGFINKLK
jgi:NAD-dependent deacetylase